VGVVCDSRLFVLGPFNRSSVFVVGLLMTDDWWCEERATAFPVGAWILKFASDAEIMAALSKVIMFPLLLLPPRENFQVMQWADQETAECFLKFLFDYFHFYVSDVECQMKPNSPMILKIIRITIDSHNTTSICCSYLFVRVTTCFGPN